MSKPKAKKPKFVAPRIEPPKTKEDAAQLLARLGVLAASISGVMQAADIEVSTIELRALKDIGPLAAEQKAIIKRLRAWADKGRADLVDPGTKTITLTTGTLLWRLGPEALELTEGVEEDFLIRRLRTAGFAGCVRVKEEINKDAIKDQWAHLLESKPPIGCLELIQREFFDIKPSTLSQPIEVKTNTTEIVDALDGQPRKKGKS